MKIPERKDDSAESFSEQQAAIAKEVQDILDVRFDKELKALLDKGKDK